jgi:hypothetical protein
MNNERSTRPEAGGQPVASPKSAEDSLAEQIGKVTPDQARGTREALEQVRQTKQKKGEQ